jgi:predicted metal-dependent phosphoesterase TrpH
VAVDLHLHTHHSDGTWSPTQLVARAIELKLSHIALTDHDTMAGVEEAQECAAGRLQVIPAIEINTVWQGENQQFQDVHILGYYLDKNSWQLQQLLCRQQEARRKLVFATVERLAELKFGLTIEMVEQCAGLGSIGRPHITQAIVNCGGAKDVVEAYERYMVPASPYYVRRESVNPVEAIEAINQAGGVASLAHPGRVEQSKDLILMLKHCGLRALEAYHRRHSLQTVRRNIRFAHDNGLAVTGGSDCHGPLAEYSATVGSISVPLDVVTKLLDLCNR